MKKILFPTDFSEPSLKAFAFALDYAKKMNHIIVVFHAYNTSAQPNQQLKAIYDAINIENYKEENKPFPPIEALISDKDFTNIKYVVRKGSFIEALKQYVDDKEDKIELVIMGSHDRSVFMELFIEAQTLKVIKEINKPVVAVPEKVNFDGNLDNILFLVDYKDSEKQPLIELIEKAKAFDAKLHVLHFDLSHTESITPIMEEFKESLKVNHFDNVEFVSIDSIDIKKSLNAYCQNNHIDMVCLMNHDKNFYQRFLMQSIAEDLIKNINTPVMAIYEEN